MDIPFRVTGPLAKVLEVLLDQPHLEQHGYQVAQEAGLKSGSLYPIMKRLEEAAWVTSHWQEDRDDRGPRRRLYRLTPLGINGGGQVLRTRSPSQGQGAALLDFSRHLRGAQRHVRGTS